MFAVWIEKIKAQATINKMFVCAASFAFLVLCANTKIFLPISPVPITMHTFAIALLGCLLPLRYSMGCFVVYLIEGLLGSPFIGIPITFGPSFGYYMGMFVSLILISKLSKITKIPLLLSLVLSSLCIWAFGVLHLQFLVGFKNAVMVGIVPFIIGDAFKLCAAYSIIATVRKKNLNLV